MPRREPLQRQAVWVEIEGRRLELSNLDKVLYRSTGATKGEVIDYYVRIAPVMLPHIADRALTLRRFPDGPAGESFFQKRCPPHRPDWVGTFRGPGERDGGIAYCALDSVAALAWAANLAALEIHAPMARAQDIDSPTMCVFDLDPGPGAGMRECCVIALAIRDLLSRLAGIDCCAKTSGGKGLQVYVPLNTPHSHQHCSSFALEVAQALEAHDPGGVTTLMRRSARQGKVFVDWSQNSRHKTTVAPYSLRAMERPTVSTPVRWDEVESAAAGAPLGFEMHQVLARAAAMGDLFAATSTLRQRLPAPAAATGAVRGRFSRSIRARGAPMSNTAQTTTRSKRRAGMNRRDLVKAVSAQTGLGAKEVDTVLKGFTDVTTAVVSKGEPVAISGFAKFTKVERPARMGRNPSTGEPMRIKASKKARITPLKAFKDAVMSPSQAPKLARGVWPPAASPSRAAASKAGAKPAAPARKAAVKRSPARTAAAANRTTRS